MGFIGVVIPNHVKISHCVETLTLALFHDLTEVIAPLHTSMDLPDFRRPQAKACTRYGILHETLKSGPSDRSDIVSRIEATEQDRVPIRNMRVN
jgi:hypothetical protein